MAVQPNKLRLQKLLEGLNRTIALGGSNLTFTTGYVKPGSYGERMATPVLLTDPGDTDADALTEITHAGRTLVIPAIGQNSTFTIPTPSEAGVFYHFIYHSTATEAQNLILKTVTTDGSVDFRGSLNHIIVDPDASATNAQLGAFGDGNSNDILTIATPSSIDLWMVAGATDYWYCWGTITSATKPAFSDS